MASAEHSGHRKRLDDKSNRIGFEFMEEHEQLEKLLFVAIPQGNTNVIAHRLLKQCGSLYGVLTAEPEELVKVDGVGNRVAQYLHDLYPLLGSVERCMMREHEKEYPCIRTVEARGEFVKTLFYGKLVENLYMISLNKRFQAYRFDKISEGSAEEAPVYIQEMVKQALRTKAYYVIIAHNHPSGDLNPSQADITVTRELYRGLDAVGITLLDHIIVGGGRFVSLKHLEVF